MALSRPLPVAAAPCVVSRRGGGVFAPRFKALAIRIDAFVAGGGGVVGVALTLPHCHNIYSSWSRDRLRWFWRGRKYQISTREKLNNLEREITLGKQKKCVGMTCMICIAAWGRFVKAFNGLLPPVV